MRRRSSKKNRVTKVGGRKVNLLSQGPLRSLRYEMLEDRRLLSAQSPSDIFSLSHGNLYDTTTSQLIANNVASFAHSHGELCYLQNNGQLHLYGNINPIASNIANFAIDASGTIIYENLQRVLNAVGDQQPLDSGVVLFKMDGGGAPVVLDQNGNLIRFTPGSETPKVLDTSVSTFGIDGSGSVVSLDSNGVLNSFAPGSYTAQALDTSISEFAIDGAGSIVALEEAGPASITLANDQVYSTPSYTMVRFAPGSTVKEVMDTGVTTLALDSAGSVVALDNLAPSSVTLANGQVYSIPSYTMVRFAPGSTVKQTMDTGITQMALDGAGSIVVLEGLTTTPAVTLGNGQISNTPVFSLVEFTPASMVKQTIDSGVSRFAVDTAGAVIGLDNWSVKDETLTNGQAYPLWSIVSFSAPLYSRTLMDTSPVSTFVLDGSGSVVALDNLSLSSLSGASNSGSSVSSTPVFDLVRLAPGTTQGSYLRQIMASDVSRIVVDSSRCIVRADRRSLAIRKLL